MPGPDRPDPHPNPPDPPSPKKYTYKTLIFGSPGAIQTQQLMINGLNNLEPGWRIAFVITSPTGVIFANILVILEKEEK